MKHTRSHDYFSRALKVMPGGVSSPVRAFRAVGGEPPVIVRGEGPFLIDADDNRYIDYICSWGPLILGHAPQKVVAALHEAAQQGTSFGAATAREVELAERVVKAVPSLEKVRFVNSGTEATMSALRLARGFTHRDRVIKFSGCYHGHADAFLSEAGSGVATLGVAGSAGVPEGAAHDTLTVPFNDLNGVEDVMRKHGPSVAAIIVEPVACNMGMVLPQDGFLAGLRTICDRTGALLIFDEVITGFRLGLSGAQGRFGIRPDLTTFGKIIGGGLPVGAYGGRAEIMDQIAPLGPVYQAGTLSGNPLAMAAGIATLDALEAPGFYARLDDMTARLCHGLEAVLDRHGKPARVDRIASIFYLWFNPEAKAPPRNYQEIKGADAKAFGAVFSALLEKGIYLAPSAYEVGFVSAAHSANEIDTTIAMLDDVLKHQ